MTTPNDDRPLEEQAKSLFDDSVERLDAETLSKLNQGRQAALAELEDTSPAKQWLRWAPATGVAAAAVVAVMVLRGPAVETPRPDSEAMDFELLMTEDSLEMLEELDFYSSIDVVIESDPDNVG